MTPEEYRADNTTMTPEEYRADDTTMTPEEYRDALFNIIGNSKMARDHISHLIKLIYFYGTTR